MNFRLGRRTRIAAVSALAAASLLLTACTGGGDGPSSGEENSIDGGLATSIDEAVESALAQSGSTQAIVGVWGSGESGDYVHGYGGVDAGAQFRAAQASQPVMCALLLDRIGKGPLELDRKVSEDLSRQVGIDDITYSQLCTQTSGLADYKKNYVDIFVENPTRPWGSRELLSEALVRSPLKWPGLNFNQSDTNAVLLARALEISSNDSLDDLLEDRVFDPAGMSSTYYPDTDSVALADGALTGLTYPSKGGKPVCDVEEPTSVPEVSGTMLSGAGATVTTAEDLKTFYEKYLSGSFGGEDLAGVPTDLIPTKNPERDDDGNPIEDEDAEEEEPNPNARMWGFGVENKGPLYGRSGAITGTITAAFHDPDSGYTVVVALNNSSAGANFARDLAFKIASLSADAGAGPEVPWSVEDQDAALEERAVCQ